MTAEQLLERLDRKLTEFLERAERRDAERERRWEEHERRWQEDARRREERWHAHEEEHRRFQKELWQTHAQITQELIGAIQRGSAELQAEIRDQREQIQANTAALLRVLDRFGSGPQAA